MVIIRNNALQYVTLKAVESIVVMDSGFWSEDQSSIPDATKDPQSACGVRACKVRGSESPFVGS